MKKGLIIGIIVLVLAGAGVYALTRGDDEATDTTATTTTNDADTNTDTNDDDDQPANGQTVTITYTDDGFSPASLTVKAGTTVTVQNNSSQQMQFASDPHPAHTDNEEINAGVIEPGQSRTFTAERTGTYGFHDHFNESQTGTLVVQ